MKPHSIAALAALALTVLAAGSASPAARATACGRTDAVVFYTTDTVRLATELGKFAEPCTDYYLSITPTAAGGPRTGPIPAIRSLGSHFHAMVEVRLPLWKSYGEANGWYDAGVELRREMVAAGYDVSLGDTWAINEVGEPSATAMGVDVLKGNGTARWDLRDFVRGLYTGPDGTPDPGVVFAADPLQVTSDLSQYAQDLRGWYSDSAFWQDMSSYVRFWAQETYADARAWGVAGATLAQRAAYLNDYFLHAAGVAAAGEGSMEAARAFFAATYTPLGNASFRWPIPDTATGIGFGYTDIGLVGMLNFVSSQTFALRSSTPARFGFAVAPKNGVADDYLAVDDRLAAAIRDSAADPSGACGQSSEWCDTDVPGAQFNDSWKALADATPPTITAHVAGPLGSNGWYTGDVTVTWAVSDPESPVWSTSGCAPTTISDDTAGAMLTCTAASYAGTASVAVTVKRDVTAPIASCAATPSILWPPNGELVPVEVAVTVADSMSGPDGFTLTGAATSGGGADDIAGFEIGTPDVAGLLRAKRPGTVDERTYALTYTAYDAAGNATQCVATVVVPHDQQT